MLRQGTHFILAFRFSLLGAFLAVLLLSVNSWASCQRFSDWDQCSNYYSGCTKTIEQGGYTVSCQYGSSCTSENTLCSTLRPCKSGCEGATWQYGNKYFAGGYNTNASDDYCTNANSGCNGVAMYDRLTCGARVVCTTQCEADSVACVDGNWVHTADTCYCNTCDEQCQCEEQGMIWTGTECIEDTTLCADLREQCQAAKGVFSGSANGGCCVATCNQCGELKRLVHLKQAQCCNQGLAPPDSVMQCRVEARNTCGMNWSTYITDDNEFECQDPSLSQDASQRYVDECFDQFSSSSQQGGSSSSEGGSSGGDSSGGGSSGDDGGCPECDLLEDIKDTLHLIRLGVDDIVSCLTTPSLCGALQIDFPDIPVFQFDSAFRKYLRPLMDSMLKVDSNQLKALLKLDTNALKALRNDSALLENDSSTRIQIVAGFHTADTNFLRLRDGVWQMDSAMQQHLQELISKIPDSILDSIRKYQDSSIDLLDTALFGENVGFSLVDSLIDSAVKYFQLSTHYDSVYNVLFGDSIGSLHAEISDLPGRNASAIGSALGYGDTASTNLRGDLQGIKDAITDGFGGLDSAWGDGEAPSDTVGDGPYGGFDDGSDSVGNDYLQTLGGLLDSAINDTGVFNPIFGRDSGSVDWDSAYSLPDVDSLKAHLDSSIIVQRSEIEDSLQAGFDSLKGEFMLLDYDSLILAPLGMRVPNTNTCPAHCFQFEIGDGTGSQLWLGSVGNLEFGVCKPLPGFSFDVLYLIRIVGRLFTALFCVYIGLWFIAGRKN